METADRFTKYLCNEIQTTKIKSWRKLTWSSGYPQASRPRGPWVDFQ